MLGVWNQANSRLERGIIDYYDNDVTYDENSGITLVENNVHVGFDVDFTMDELDRLIKAEEGTWTTQIDSRTRQEIWNLTQTGNWDLYQRGLNGDADFIDTGETDEERTHNKANELTDRDIDNDDDDVYDDVQYDLDHDANGNLTDDKENYGARKGVRMIILQLSVGA